MMQATKIAFEKRYSDDSGVEFGVRLNGSEIELESINTINFPIEEIDWLIAALQRIQGRTRATEGQAVSDEKIIPKWKLVDCPTCRSVAGTSCCRPSRSQWGRWERCSPHIARKMRAAAIGNKLEKSDE